MKGPVKLKATETQAEQRGTANQKLNIEKGEAKMQAVRVRKHPATRQLLPSVIINASCVTSRQKSAGEGGRTPMTAHPCIHYIIFMSHTEAHRRRINTVQKQV